MSPASKSPSDTASGEPAGASALSSNESSSFTFSSLLARIAAIIGDPEDSDERLDPITGRVCTADEFRQDEGQSFGKADILFIQDTSGSMRDEWRRVATNAQYMMQQLPSGVDVRVGVMLAHVGPNAGKLYSARGQPAVLSNRSLSNDQIGRSLYATFESGAQQTDRALGEASFYSLNYAITSQLAANQRAGFFRPDAVLAVVFMSDEQELGFPFPVRQGPGIPPRCADEEYWENRFKRDYYDNQKLTVDVLADRLKRLKGEVPVTTHAFVNITREDLFRRNSPNASCLIDSLGYGYFEMIQRTKGVLWSLQNDRVQGMIRIGQSVGDSLDLIKDFRLSKPADRVDPATIKAFVDNRRVSHTYTPATNIVRLEDSGTFGSKIKIDHCDFYRRNWTIQDFRGVPAIDSITLSWRTPSTATKAVVKVGLTRENLNFRTINVDDAKIDHTLLVPNLSPATTYYFQVAASDAFGGNALSEVIAVTTLEAPRLWTIEEFGGIAGIRDATLAWKTPGEETRARLLVGLAADDLSLMNLPVENFAVAQEKLVNELNPNTFYFFKVIAEDRRGRKVESAVISLRTKEEPPRDWQIVGFDATTTIDSALIFWQTQDFPAKGILRVGLSADNLSFREVLMPEFRTAQQVTVEGLTPDTLYFFQVEAEDQLGRKRISAVISKRTKPDPITWSLQSFQGEPTYNSINASWSTGNEPTKALLQVGLSRENLSFREYKIDSLSGNHSQLITELSELTSYFLQVTATDAKGRSLKSEIIEVKTLEEPIRWSVRNLQGMPSFNAIQLSWDTGVELTRAVVAMGRSASNLNEKQIAVDDFKTDHAVTFEQLTEKTLYFFQVTAFDKRGRPVQSPIISLETLEEPIFWNVLNLAGDPTYNTIRTTWNTGTESTRAVLRVGLSATDLSFKRIDVPNFNTAHEVLLEGLSELTNYFLEVEAFDRKGRPVKSGVLMVRTLEEPMRWSIAGPVGTPGFDRMDLAWSTGTEATRAIIRIGLNESDLSHRVIEVPVYSAAHNVPVAGLVELTDYYVQIEAFDRRNRSQKSAVVKVRTLEEPIRWSITGPSGVPTYNTIQASWATGNEPTTAVLRVGLNANDLSFREVRIDTAQAAHSLLIEGLSEMTDYFLQVEAFDRRNRPVKSAVVKVRTLEEPIRWVIAGLAGLPTYNTIQATWNTGEEPTKAILRVGLSAEDLSFKQITVNLAQTNHSVLIDGLTELTDYFLQVEAFDRRNRPVKSAVVKVRTLEEPIRWSIQGPTGLPSYDRIDLSWATGNEATRAILRVGLSENDLSFREVRLDQFKTTQAITVLGLTELTDYYFQVEAFDRRNRPVKSPTILVRTLEEPIRWSIAGFQGVPTYNSVNLSWNTGTEPTTAILRVGLTAEDLSFREVRISQPGTAHAQLVEGLTELTDYFFQVEAFDRRNRPVKSAVIKVRTLEEPIRWSIAGFSGIPTYNTIQTSWSTGEEPTTAILRVGLTANNLTFKEIRMTNAQQSHSLLVDGLTELTDYFLQVEAFDRRNRPVKSAVIKVTTLEEPIRWNISGISGTTTYNSATITWNTGTELTRATVKVGLMENDFSFRAMNVEALRNSHTLEVPNLSELTDYYFQITAFDRRNRPVVSPVLKLRTLEEPIFWSIQGLRGSTEWNLANISWNTGNEPTRAILRVGLSANDLSFREIEISDARTAHTQLVDGLSELTTYYFQVQAFDRRNRSLTSDILTLSTPVEPILWNIAGFSARAGFTDVSLNWQTSGEATRAVVRVGLSADNLTLREVPVSDLAEMHLLVVDGLQQNTTYFFQVQAFDRRNRSKTSGVISAKTDEQVWRVLGLDATTSTNSATAIWQTQSTLTKGSLRVGLSANDLSLIEIQIPDFKTQHLVTVTGLNPNTRYFFQVEARDELGRKVVSNVISKLTKPVALSPTGLIGSLDK